MPINGLSMANQHAIEAVPIDNVYFEARKVERIPSCQSSVMMTIVAGGLDLGVLQPLAATDNRTRNYSVGCRTQLSQPLDASTFSSRFSAF